MQTRAFQGTLPHNEIAARAQQIYVQSGCIPGRDLENWLLAESQLKAEKQTAALEKQRPMEPAKGGGKLNGNQENLRKPELRSRQ
jgi:hypothetical protein